MWRWIITVVVLVALAGAIYLAAVQPELVDAVAAERRGLTSYVEARARTRLPRTHRVTMPVDGRILPIELREGDAVRAGQVVAQIEMADLETAVAVADARVRRLEARIVENNDTRLEQSTIDELVRVLESIDRSVEASVAQTEASRARETFHVTDLQRKRDAYADDAATKKEVEEAELADIESRVQLRTDVLALRALEAIREAARIWPLQVRQVIDKKSLTAAVLEHELAEAQAARDQAVRDRERSVVRAPVDGVVLRRAVSNERMLPAGQLLLEIGDLAVLEIAVDVLSQEAMEIAPDDPVDIVGPALGPDPVRGRVARIEPRGFTKVSSLGVEQQRVWVIIELEPGTLERLAETGRTLGVGYRLRVRIHTDGRLETVVIPRAALFRGPDDAWQTFVLRGGRARLVDLQVGLMNDREVEVLRGVETGEAVVVAPPAGLAGGTRVRARDRAEP